MKIKYVQLESDAFLTDLDFMQFTPAERGIYCSLIFLLYSNGGKYELDPAALSKMCNCTRKEFEKVWGKIEKKFQTRKGVIRHKRVTKELRKSKKQWQDKRRAGLKGARVTWQSHGNANGSDNGDAMAKIREEKRREDKGSKGKKSEEKLSQEKRRKSKEKDNNISNSNNQFSSSSTSVRFRDGHRPDENHESILEQTPETQSGQPLRPRGTQTSAGSVEAWLPPDRPDGENSPCHFDRAKRAEKSGFDSVNAERKPGPSTPPGMTRGTPPGMTNSASSDMASDNSPGPGCPHPDSNVESGKTHDDEREKQELKAELQRFRMRFGLGPRGVRDEPMPTDAQLEQRRQAQLKALGGNGHKPSHGGNGSKGSNGVGHPLHSLRSLRLRQAQSKRGCHPTLDNKEVSHSLPPAELTGGKVDASGDIRALNFHESLTKILRPRSRSDRTCFRNVTNWLVEMHARGKFGDEVFGRVLDFAREAGAGNRPAAVFMAILKKELGYGR